MSSFNRRIHSILGWFKLFFVLPFKLLYVMIANMIMAKRGRKRFYKQLLINGVPEDTAVNLSLRYERLHVRDTIKKIRNR